jgi:hypothetical protein
MKDERIPAKITLDAYAASHRAVAYLKEKSELPKRVRVRTSKYLNNAIEQDHRRVKQRLRSMLGLKSFRTAAVVIGGLELAEKIKKGHLNSVSSAAAGQRCQRSGKLPWLHNRDNSSIAGQDRPNLATSRNCTRAIAGPSVNVQSTKGCPRPARFQRRFLCGADLCILQPHEALTVPWRE